MAGRNQQAKTEFQYFIEIGRSNHKKPEFEYKTAGSAGYFIDT